MIMSITQQDLIMLLHTVNPARLSSTTSTVRTHWHSQCDISFPGSNANFKSLPLFNYFQFIVFTVYEHDKICIMPPRVYCPGYTSVRTVSLIYATVFEPIFLQTTMQFFRPITPPCRNVVGGVGTD